MNKSYLKLSGIALFISTSFFIVSCEKVSEYNEDIDQLIEETLKIKAIAEPFNQSGNNGNEIKNLFIDGQNASSEIKVNVSAGVPYSYEHKRYTLNGSAWTIKTNTYSGTIAKSYFTNKSGVNTVQVSTMNISPVLTVNGTTVSSGTSSGSGGGTSTTPPTTPTNQVLVDKDLAGESYETKTVSFTVPSGVKTMTIRTTESASAYRNTADLFVRKGSAPIVKGPKPPSNTPAYSWTADCHGIKPNREDELCTFSSPGSGTWYVTLYGYNTYFSSRLLVTITK